MTRVTVVIHRMATAVGEFHGIIVAVVVVAAATAAAFGGLLFEAAVEDAVE